MEVTRHKALASLARKCTVFWVACWLLSPATAPVLWAQSSPPPAGKSSNDRPQVSATPTRANILRGEYGRYRANNDLLFYHLDLRVDPEKKLISGKNTIRFRMRRTAAAVSGLAF